MATVHPVIVQRSGIQDVKMKEKFRRISSSLDLQAFASSPSSPPPRTRSRSRSPPTVCQFLRDRRFHIHRCQEYCLELNCTKKNNNDSTNERRWIVFHYLCIHAVCSMHKTERRRSERPIRRYTYTYQS
jgi:hypothetical protein